MEALIFSYSMGNIHPDTITKQRAVVEKFNKSKHQHFHLQGDVRPGMFMDAVCNQLLIDMKLDPEVIVFLDVDAVPLNEDALDYLVARAKEGYLVGNAQRSNHINNNKHIFVAPAVLAIRRDIYEKLGRPSFLETPRGDVAEEVTYKAEEQGIPIEYLWPLSFDESPAECPNWPLADGQPVYGRWTTFGLEGKPMFLHAFQIFHPGQQQKFWARCEALLNT